MAKHGRPKRVDIKNDRLEFGTRLNDKLRLPVEGFEVRFVCKLEFKSVILGVSIHDFENNGRSVVKYLFQLFTHRGNDAERSKSTTIDAGQRSGKM